MTGNRHRFTLLLWMCLSPWLEFQKDGIFRANATTDRNSSSSVTRYDYIEILTKSIFFYRAQRSGHLPEDNGVWWRGDSCVNDSGDNGEDLSGGWYDAGDCIKFGFPMASSTTLLAWGALTRGIAYETSRLSDDIRDCIKWPLDFFMKAHVAPNELYVQVGDPALRKNYWGRPEDVREVRPTFKIDVDHPGSDVAAETAAAMAAGAIVFNESDSLYSSRLIQHARELFGFAFAHRGRYSESIERAKVYYPSSAYEDELAMASAWLYKATGEKWYLDTAVKFYNTFDIPWAFSWDDKQAGTMILLYEITGDERYRRDIIKTLDSWLPGGSMLYTPKGLAFRDSWGSLRYAANFAFIAMEAARLGIKPSIYSRWARSQIGYILGDTGRSYVVGFGVDPPQMPHHAASSCGRIFVPCSWKAYDSTIPNPHILYGAVVGGPDIDDRYSDTRVDYVHNEVACDYNAGFTSAVAALLEMEMKTKDLSKTTVTTSPPSSSPSLSSSSYAVNVRQRNAFCFDILITVSIFHLIVMQRF